MTGARRDQQFASIHDEVYLQVQSLMLQTRITAQLRNLLRSNDQATSRIQVVVEQFVDPDSSSTNIGIRTTSTTLFNENRDANSFKPREVCRLYLSGLY